MNFKLLKKEMQPQETVRIGLKKATIRGDYTDRNDIEFWKKRNGSIEIKWSSHIPVKSSKTIRCNRGHSHEVETNEAWIWDYALLSPEQIEKLREFLS